MYSVCKADKKRHLAGDTRDIFTSVGTAVIFRNCGGTTVVNIILIYIFAFTAQIIM
jgi:hypothetical protein